MKHKKEPTPLGEGSNTILSAVPRAALLCLYFNIFIFQTRKSHGLSARGELLGGLVKFANENRNVAINIHVDRLNETHEYLPTFNSVRMFQEVHYHCVDRAV